MSPCAGKGGSFCPERSAQGRCSTRFSTLWGCPSRPGTWSSCATAIEDYLPQLAALGEARAVICGFSLGAIVAAHIAGRLPPDEPPDAVRARRMAYFRSMADGPRPGVAVIEDMDGTAALGAWWGEVHARVHGGVFGLSGAVTNGVVRDLGDLPDGFPVLAGGIGPSHGFVHVKKIGAPVEIFGLTVAEGDLVHADRHGALVIPPSTWPRLAEALDKLAASEALVLEPLRGGPVTLESFLEHWAAFEKART